jgi:hypothetical protein
MSVWSEVMKWIGVAAIVLIVLPTLGILARDLPGAWREVKGLKMGHVGGWHQAH